MKTVDILTANNITIQYECASIVNRGAALILDFIIIGVYSGIMSIIVGLMSFSASEPTVTVVSYIFVLLPIMFYSLLLDYFLKGQTFGKMALGIRVVKVNGENANLNDYAMRWVFKIVDFWVSFGGIGALFISTSDKSQRLGDVLAQTVVVKKESEVKYSIKDILNIKNKSSYEPTYLNVVSFNDDDVILIKNAISRVKKYPNENHKQFVRDLANIVSEKLSLDAVPVQKITFLKTVLQDYIVLTR